MVRGLAYRDRAAAHSGPRGRTRIPACFGFRGREAGRQLRSLSLIGLPSKDKMKRINHSKLTGGHALASYGYKWAAISARLGVKHLAMQALTAMDGPRAARAAIREARRVSRQPR
jgi:hypothetical protein